MPNLQSAVTVIALTAVGIIIGGWVMNKFQGQVQFLADASEGFQGI